MSKHRGFLPILVCVLVIVWTTSPAHAQCTKARQQSNHSSGTGLPGTPNPPCNPWGMWVWSQPSNNNYGNDGNGSMYFYAIHKAEAHVQASNVTLSGSSVSETVSGAYPDGTAVIAHWLPIRPAPERASLIQCPAPWAMIRARQPTYQSRWT